MTKRKVTVNTCMTVTERRSIITVLLNQIYSSAAFALLTVSKYTLIVLLAILYKTCTRPHNGMPAHPPPTLTFSDLGFDSETGVCVIIMPKAIHHRS
jgi:hypothetical protein